MKKPPPQDDVLEHLEMEMDRLQCFAFGEGEVVDASLPAIATLGQAAAMRRLFLARRAGDHEAATQHLEEMREWRLSKGFKKE